MRTLSAVVLAACLIWVPAIARAQITKQKHLSAGAVAFVGDPWYPLVSIGGTASNRAGATIGGDTGVAVGVGDGSASEPLFLASVLAGVQPPREVRGTRIQPFAFVGAVLVGAEVGWVVEAGTHYWITKAIGVRSDIRLLRPFTGEGGAIGVRVGIALR